MIKSRYIKKIQGLPIYYNIKFPVLLELNKETLDFLDHIDRASLAELHRHKKIVKILKDAYLIMGYKDQEIDIINKAVREYTVSVMHKSCLRGIELVVNVDCNFNCSYCMRKIITDTNKIQMEWETAKRYIDMLINQKERADDFISINFNGGEPLLNYGLIKKIVSYLDEKRIKVNYSILTNASLLTQDIADFFYINKFSVQLSIDGLNNDTVRFRKLGDDALSSIENGIKFLKSKKVKILSVVTTLTEKNWKGVNEDFLRYLKQLNITYLSINPDVLNRMPFSVKKTGNKLIGLTMKGRDIGVSVNANCLLPFNNIVLGKKRGLKKYKLTCGAKEFAQLSVLPDGKAYSCSYCQNNLSNYNNIEEYFKDSRNPDFIKGNYPLTSEFCKDCGLQGGCVTCPAVFDKLCALNKQGILKEECELKKYIFNKFIRMFYTAP